MRFQRIEDSRLCLGRRPLSGMADKQRRPTRLKRIDRADQAIQPAGKKSEIVEGGGMSLGMRVSYAAPPGACVYRLI
jgi:hypothetical protein